MTPWHLSSRTLAFRYFQTLRVHLSRGGRLSTWQGSFLRRHYSNALNELRQDETLPSMQLSAFEKTTYEPPSPDDGISEHVGAAAASSQNMKKIGSNVQKRSRLQGARRRLQEKTSELQHSSSTLREHKSRLEASPVRPGKQRSTPTLRRLKMHLDSHLGQLGDAKRSIPTLRRLKMHLEPHLGRSGKAATQTRSSKAEARVANHQDSRMATRHTRRGRKVGRAREPAIARLRTQATHALLRKRRVQKVRRAMKARQRSNLTMDPAWVSVTSSVTPSSVVSSLWNRQSAIIARPYFDQSRGLVEGQAEPTLDPVTHIWVQSTLEALDNGNTAFLIDNLPQQAVRGRQWMFMQISFWLLKYEPDRMIDFLRATHIEPYPPINWTEDALTHLARHLVYTDEAQRQRYKERLLDLFRLLAYRTTHERLRYANAFVREILPHCTRKEISELYRVIIDHGVELHGFTFLHIATHSAKEGRYEDAADSLLRAKDAGVEVNRGNFRSACSTVIRSCISQPEGLRVCLGLVSQLVDTGLQLNGPICDIIMLNAVDAGDVNTAYAVYRSLVERGLQPRESTFAILLKGCKLNIDDADMLNGTIRDAINKINVRQSPLVATEILHCLALHHSKHNPDTALRTITEAYAQLFDMKSLQLLGLPLPAIQQQRATTEEAMTPTPHAIGFMIAATIQRIQSYSERPDDIATIYARWRELVEAGHPALAELAATDHTFNIFLMAFIRTPSGLIHASRVVRDMQRPLTLPPPPTPVSPSPPREQCKPTVQTWSIFLHGFTRHNKLQLADQVLTYMRKRGIEPNDVTWSTLILGHGRAQDVEGTFAVLREAERNGYVWSRWTEDGVGRLRDRGRVAREMERRRVDEGVGDAFDFTEDLKKGVGERLRSVRGDEGSLSGEGEGYQFVPSGSLANADEGAGDKASDVHDQREPFN